MADEKNGGDNLDIFEGLGKKTQSVSPQPVAVVHGTAGGPPPPPGQSAAPPPPPHPPSMATAGINPKQTLLGLPNPSARPESASAPPPPPPPVVAVGAAQSASRLPPPPPPMSVRPSAPSQHPLSTPTPVSSPSRGAIPAATSVAPPPKSAPPPLPPGPSASAAPPPAPLPLSSAASLPPSGITPVATAVPAAIDTKPRPAASARIEGSTPGIQMDWDDDNEATHVFDKDREPLLEASFAKQTSTLIGVPNASLPVAASARAEGSVSGAPPAGPTRPSVRLAVPKSQSVPPPPPPAAARAVSAIPGALNATFPSVPPPVPGRASMHAIPTGSLPPIPGGPPIGLPSPSAPPPPKSPLSLPPTFGPLSTGPLPTSPSMGPTAGPTLASATSMTPAPAVVQTHTVPLAMPPMSSQPPIGVQSQPPRALSTPPQASVLPRSLEQTALVPPPQTNGGRGMGMVLTTIGGLAVIAIGGVFLMMPRTGTVVVNVTDAKGATLDRVDVFVDGKKECETTPCTMKKDTGPHAIKVVANGFETPEPKKFDLGSGKTESVQFALSGTGSANGSAGGTGIHATSETAGLHLFVDERDLGTLPQDVKDLTPGEHKIRISSGDRTYAVIEKTVTVVKGEILDLGTIAPKVLNGTAKFDLETEGATLQLRSGKDRREVPPTPVSLEVDTAKPWVLDATKIGYEDLHIPITFEDGRAQRTFKIALALKGSPSQTPVNTGSPAVTPVGAGVTTAAPVTTAAVAGAPATVSFNSMPASKVVLDGRPLGETPKLKISVGPGAHTALFIFTEQSQKATVPFSVKSGETRVIIGKLPQ